MARLASLIVAAGLALCNADAHEGLANLRAGTSIHAHNAALKTEMRSMMAQDDDDVDFNKLAHKGSDESWRGRVHNAAFGGTASWDDYIRESEEGLSAALGPRWGAQRVEEDANRHTKALLRGMSGSRATGAIRSMLGALGGHH